MHAPTPTGYIRDASTCVAFTRGTLTQFRGNSVSGCHECQKPVGTGLIAGTHHLATVYLTTGRLHRALERFDLVRSAADRTCEELLATPG
jgi:hypothetical protein